MSVTHIIDGLTRTLCGARPALALGIVAGLSVMTTQAPAQTSSATVPVSALAERIDVDVVAEGLSYPWSLAFLPGGDLLVTELTGGLRRINDGDTLVSITGVPEVLYGSQGGLFDVVLHPDFETNSLLYLTYAHGTVEANATRVARARLEDGALADFTVLYTATPTKNTLVHYGGRMAFLPDGTFVLTLGDGFDFREEAQRLSSDTGSILRLNEDGTIPVDNPFVGEAGKREAIYSYGHRNAQAIVVDPDSGTIFEHEHGPRGGDEVNVIRPGLNYGWPVITYGLDYSGALISPFTERAGMEQPVHVWTPSIAPAGMALYRGQAFAELDGDLLVTGLASQDLRRLDMNGETVRAEEILLDAGERLRDVRVGPDGLVYVLTDGKDGRVLRLSPR